MSDADNSSTDNSFQGLDFDPDALRAKYREERDKRLRADGNEQYVEVQGRLQPLRRRPLRRARLHPRAADRRGRGADHRRRLRRPAGRARACARPASDDIRIIEKGGDFGGTWYWNRYPGAQCDIEAYIYLPLLEETGYIPKEKYSFAPEILEHCAAHRREIRPLSRRLLPDPDQSDHAGTRTNAAGSSPPTATTACRARFVVMSNGPLNRPKLPGIPGIDTFKGHTFHTSRWDYAYTGGDTTGNLHKLADKRVGDHRHRRDRRSSACRTSARPRKHLYVFQRTPSSVDVRGNRPTDPEWAKTLTPGWQKRRMDNFNIAGLRRQQDEDLVSDGWTDIIRNLGAIAAAKRPRDPMTPQEHRRA